MRCHYEVLDVPLDVNSGELKKAYRKAALKWHPDKNIDNPDLAKEQFQLVQQAYEVLTDPHERAWYDSHRDAILKGGLGNDYKDDSLDVFPYFTPSCFKGYGDDDKGFYSVYREVFKRISTEDTEFMDDGDSDFEIPEFGTSKSDFKEVVQPFYAYWQDYATKKSYSWLDQYDIKDLPNRRVAKLVEKENKKIRDKARKDRNEEIRNLVAFVRKRDKRVQAYAALQKEQQAEKARLAEEKRKSKIRERQQQMKDYKETEWSKFSDFENELKNIEKSLQAEFGDHDSSSEEDESMAKEDEDGNEDEAEDFDALYCPACRKMFKTVKAFANHESSKKHKENVEILRQTMLEEEELLDEELEEEETDVDEEGEGASGSEEDLDEENGADEVNGEDVEDKDVDESKEKKDDTKVEVEEEDSDDLQVLSKPKKKKKKQNSVFSTFNSKGSSAEEEEEMEELAMLSKKQRRKQKQQKQRFCSNDSDAEPIAEGDHNKPSAECGETKPSDEGEETKPLGEGNDETETTAEGDTEAAVDNEDGLPKAKLKGKKAKDARKQKRQAESSASTDGIASVGKSKKANNVSVDPSVIDTEHVCVSCASHFSSKNKLFQHLQKTGHSVYLADKKGKSEAVAVDEKKKGKGRRK